MFIMVAASIRFGFHSYLALDYCFRIYTGGIAVNGNCAVSFRYLCSVSTFKHYHHNKSRQTKSMQNTTSQEQNDTPVTHIIALGDRATNSRIGVPFKTFNAVTKQEKLFQKGSECEDGWLDKCIGTMNLESLRRLAYQMSVRAKDHDVHIWNLVAERLLYIVNVLHKGTDMHTSSSENSCNSSSANRGYQRGDSNRSNMEVLARDNIVHTRESLSAIHKNITLILNYMKQIRYFNLNLFECFKGYVVDNVNTLSIHDLSIIANTYSTLYLACYSRSNETSSATVTESPYCSDAFTQCPNAALAELTINCGSKALNARPPTVSVCMSSPSIEQLYTKMAASIVDNYRHRLPPKSYLSWVHLVGAYAKVNLPSQSLFEIAAGPLCTALNQSPYLHIPHRYFSKIIRAYAKFGYRHTRLLEVMSRNIPVIQLTDEELNAVWVALKRLHYADPDIENLCRLRGVDNASS